MAIETSPSLQHYVPAPETQLPCERANNDLHVHLEKLTLHLLSSGFR